MTRRLLRIALDIACIIAFVIVFYGITIVVTVR